MPTIRPASQDDLEAIAALHVSSWQSAYRGILPDPILDQLSAEKRVDDWCRWFAVPEAHTYVAFQQHRLVGFARVVALGRPSNLQETWTRRFVNLGTFFFGQRKVLEERSSWHHFAIFWGFWVITVITARAMTKALEKSDSSVRSRAVTARSSGLSSTCCSASAS